MTVSLPSPQLTTSPLSPRASMRSSPAPPECASTPLFPRRMSLSVPPSSESGPSPPESVERVAVVLVTLSAPSPALTVIPMIAMDGQVTLEPVPTQAGSAVMVAPGSASK
jgi:hypothetical protein